MAEVESEEHLDSAEDRSWQVQLFNALTAGDLDTVKRLAAEHDTASQRFSFRTAAGLLDGAEVCTCGTEFELDLHVEAGEDAIFETGLSYPQVGATYYVSSLQQGYCSCVEEAQPQLPTAAQQAGIPLLDAGVRSGNPELVTYLLDELKCPVNETTEQTGCNALHTAVRSQADITGFLDNSSGSPPEKLVHKKENLLQIIQLLVEHGCDINLRDKSAANQSQNHPLKGHTPLSLAFRQEAEEGLLKLLIRLGADVNLPASTGVPLIQLAVGMNDVGLLGALLTGNFQDLNTVMSGEYSLLHVATIVGGNPLIVQMLLENGADPDKFGNDMTPLMWCATSNSLNIAVKLLEHGCNVNLCNQSGYTALHTAAWNGFHPLCILLLDHGATHDDQTHDLNTQLSLACHGNHHPVVEMLLQRSCNVDNSDKDKDTPIHYAAFNGAAQTVSLLLECGADLDPQNSVGATPMWNAVYGNHVEAARLLLDKGASLTVRSRGIDQMAETVHVTYCYAQPKSLLYVACDREAFDAVPLLVLAGTNLGQEEWLLNYQFPESIGESEKPKAKKTMAFLVEQLRHPPTLLRLCRSQIRAMMGWQRLHHVASLEIPRTLHDFLFLKKL